jgi:hypothetical protein
MSSTHSPLSLFGGDDWQIHVTFTDQDGAPLDLTGATILWTLLDRNGHAGIKQGSFSIASSGPGQCVLTVSAATTTTILAGSYMDYWRIITGGVATVMLMGEIVVHADPFGAAAQPAEKQTKPVIEIVQLRAA